MGYGISLTQIHGGPAMLKKNKPLIAANLSCYGKERELSGPGTKTWTGETGYGARGPEFGMGAWPSLQARISGFGTRDTGLGDWVQGPRARSETAPHTLPRIGYRGGQVIR